MSSRYGLPPSPVPSFFSVQPEDEDEFMAQPPTPVDLMNEDEHPSRQDSEEDEVYNAPEEDVDEEPVRPQRASGPDMSSAWLPRQHREAQHRQVPRAAVEDSSDDGLDDRVERLHAGLGWSDIARTRYKPLSTPPMNMYPNGCDVAEAMPGVPLSEHPPTPLKLVSAVFDPHASFSMPSAAAASVHGALPDRDRYHMWSSDDEGEGYGDNGPFTHLCTSMPDFSPLLLDLHSPKTPVFCPSASASPWRSFSEVETELAGMRPVRAMCFHLPVDMMYTDQYNDLVTTSCRARQIAMLFGLLHAGTLEHIPSGNHREFYACEADEEEDYSRERRDSVHSYMNSSSLPMFVLAHEELVDTEDSVKAVRIWKFVFDRSHSDSILVSRIMSRNQHSESTRGKRKRAHAYEEVKNESDLYNLLVNYSGYRDKKHKGAPLARFHKCVGFYNTPISKGHVLGPEYAFNAKRGEALRAGLVDLKTGEPLDVRPELLRVNSYWAEDNTTFRVPEPAKSHIFFNVDPYKPSLLNTPTPRKPTSGAANGPVAAVASGNRATVNATPGSPKPISRGDRLDSTCALNHDLVAYARKAFGDTPGGMTTAHVKDWYKKDMVNRLPERFKGKVFGTDHGDLQVCHIISKAKGGHDWVYNYFIDIAGVNRYFAKYMPKEWDDYIGKEACSYAETFAQWVEKRAKAVLTFGGFDPIMDHFTAR